jgi:hypothetical protein
MAQNGQTLSCGYDAAGNRTSLTWPASAYPLTASYTYDGLSNMVQVS